MEFLTVLCDSIERDGAAQFDIDALWDGEAQKEGFLAYNYDNPRVAAVILKIESFALAKRPDNADNKEYFVQLKSGKMKENLIKFRKEDGRPMPESLPSENGQPPKAGSVSANPPAQPSNPPSSNARTSAVPHASQTPLWLWVVGPAALAAIASWIWKRRR